MLIRPLGQRALAMQTSACWFKLKKREYGPAGTATEQWVALGKRAAASGGRAKKKAKAA